MTIHQGLGISVDVPRGWEARISQAAAQPGDHPGESHYPYLHLASFPLPPVRAHYGGGAVESMRPDDAFVAVLDFGQDAAHSKLFELKGLPTKLSRAQFSARQLQRMLPGQLGSQQFCTVNGRGIVLYVVLGGAAALRTKVPVITTILPTISLSNEVPSP